MKSDTANRLETVLEPSRRLPVTREADVVVQGGGPAGLAAALAAASTRWSSEASPAAPPSAGGSAGTATILSLRLGRPNWTLAQGT